MTDAPAGGPVKGKDGAEPSARWPASMGARRSTAWHELEVTGSLVYFFLMLSIFLTGLVMLLLANIDPQGIIIPSLLIIISLFCSLMTFMRKRMNRPAGAFAWIAASIFVAMPVAQKFNYVHLYGWEVALASYNSSVTIIIAVVITQFLYDKRLFRVLAVFALAGWTAFLLMAYLSGTPMSIHSVKDGQGVGHFVVLREVFIMMVAVIAWFAAYRIIPITENYDERTTEQRKTIEAHNVLLESEVWERTEDLWKTTEMLQRRNLQIESELDMARQIFNKLNPEQSAGITGIDLFPLNISMDKVGGDFYGVRQQDDSIELILADVSGHGLQAAFLSLITKMAYDGAPEGDDPDVRLGSLNRVVCRSAVRGNFVTAFCCRIDVRDRIIRFSSAGHCPAVMFNRESGDLRELSVRGIPLGWNGAFRYNLGETPLSPGDRLILYTDGIPECRNSMRELFGTERLFEFIRTNPGLPPREFSHSLLSRLHEYTGMDVFHDDLSLIVCDIEC